MYKCTGNIPFLKNQPFTSYLGVEMVGQDAEEMRLDGERLVKELLVESLLDIVDENHCHTL